MQYGIDRERKEGIVNKEGRLIMTLDKTLINKNKVTDTYIQKAEMGNQPPPPSQDISSLPDFPALEHGYLPIICSLTTTVTLRIVHLICKTKTTIAVVLSESR